MVLHTVASWACEWPSLVGVQKLVSMVTGMRYSPDRVFWVLSLCRRHCFVLLGKTMFGKTAMNGLASHQGGGGGGGIVEILRPDASS